MLVTGYCQKATWVEHPDTNKQGARYYPDRTLEACQAQCFALSDCTAIDFNKVTPYNRCWLHGAWSANNPLVPAAAPNQISHYILTRITYSCK